MKRFLLWLRTTFVSGLLAILPVGATIVIILTLYRMIDSFVGRGTPIGMTIERGDDGSLWMIEDGELSGSAGEGPDAA